MARPFASVAERIEQRAVRIPFAGCWIYEGSVNNKGYAYMHVNGRASLAHRASYEHFIGPIPKGMHVCHHCDTPACCNPHHLFIGTAKDNMRDASAKGRTRTTPTLLGQQVPFSRLNEAQVHEIRRRHAAGETQHKLAEAFGVSQPAIGQIVNRRVWKHV